MKGQPHGISELAREFAVTPRALRFYEQKGLLAPLRRGRTRLYSRRDRGRLVLILQGRRLGFGLAEIKDMLDLYDLGDGQVAQLRFAIERANERIQVLERRRRDIEKTLRGLRQAKARIEACLREKTARPQRERGAEAKADARS
jgi:DNA-binding transcriptional MerR regulator